MKILRSILSALAAVLASAYIVAAQGGDLFSASIEHPAIQYSSRPTHDAIAELDRKVQAGEVKLTFDSKLGYLRSVMAALDLPVESQTLVYSPTSVQTEFINELTPRALYFNDTASVGWVNGGDLLELSALDPEQGEIFWALKQQSREKPQFVRTRQCLQCHYSTSTSGVPGLFFMSMLPLSDNQNEYAQGWPVDDRTPIEDRWGGWYVTGAQAPARHLGNVQVNHAPKSYVRLPAAPVLANAKGKIANDTYLTPYSDVVALLVLNHQGRMVDLLTRLGWEARISSPQVRNIAHDVADYMLFTEEVNLPRPVKGNSGFAELFSSKGPRDKQGRSLRDLDLAHRLMRYPCSYMIYSPMFDALPAPAKEMVYARLWEILSGKDRDQKYARLSPADRTAVIEILRDTKKGLPAYFSPVGR
jgi:hypothetical protein